jgi:hypothetical protein
MASPKHPQSVTGLKTARMKVSMVKNPIKNNAVHAVRFLNIPVTSAKPMRNSAPLRRNENIREMVRSSGNPAAIKYSENLYADPRGSIHLTNPLKINTRPSAMRQILKNIFRNCSFIVIIIWLNT